MSQTQFPRSQIAQSVPSTYPFFWKEPIRYCRWAAHHKPAIFWSIIIGGAGPLMLMVGIPIRKYYGIEPQGPIPMSYPVPTGKRQIPSGYDD